MDDTDPIDLSRRLSYSDPGTNSRPNADVTTANLAQNNIVLNTKFLNTDGNATNWHNK